MVDAGNIPAPKVSSSTRFYYCKTIWKYLAQVSGFKISLTENKK